MQQRANYQLCGTTGDNGGSGIYTYYFSIDNGSTWIGSNASGNYTFTGLTVDTTYSIKQKAVDNAGNETISSTLTAKTLPAYRTENFVVTAVLANCGQYQQDCSGSDTTHSSGEVNTSLVRATAGTSTIMQERKWTSTAGYKGATLKTIVDNHLNANYAGWTSYNVDAKLNLQINIDFNSGNTQRRCQMWYMDCRADRNR